MVPLLAAALLALAASAHGQSGQYGFIKDADHQAYCRATNGGGSGQCGLIRNRDMQAECRAKSG